MISGFTSGQIIRLRHCLQRGIAYNDPVELTQVNVIIGNLAAEVAARIAGDAALQAQITAEVAARIAADAALQAQITDLQQPRYAPQMLLGGM